MFCRNSVTWVYRLDRNFTWKSKHEIPEDLVFFDQKKKVRLIVEADGRITITRGYSWNGCSPKFCILDLMIGTPDGVVHECTGRPKTYHASLVHDALYQFLPEGLPLKRRHADRFFLQLMVESEFLPRWIYWTVVRLLGWIVRWATAKKREHQGYARSAKGLAADWSDAEEDG